MSSETQGESDTLRILHLPPHLSNENRNRLFQRYGAVRTRTLRPSKNYTITFAKFGSHDAATEAFLRLHQLKIRDQYLSVEFAKKSIPSELNESENQDETFTKEKAKEDSVNKSYFKAFVQRLNSWVTNETFMQPPPPHIRYKYLPPTKSTLLRILIQLLKEPVFYTQVLHLMNRLNLPPPFEELEREFPMLKEVYDMEKYIDFLGKDIIGGKTVKGESSDEEESEIESCDESQNKHLEIIPVKRKKSQSSKRLKIPKFINPAKQNVHSSYPQKMIKPEDVFEPVHHGEAKHMKIELKNVNKLLDESNRLPETNPIDVPQSNSGFGVILSSKTENDTENMEDIENDKAGDTKKVEFITSEELASNKISANDQRILPVFKNYHRGVPSNRLYIKNLAKQVEEADLHFIYGKYLPSKLDNTNKEYNVRLMREGRMKGQAFITFPNVAQAQLALDETNGYILKDKPMVVQFAKVANS